MGEARIWSLPLSQIAFSWISAANRHVEEYGAVQKRVISHTRNYQNKRTSCAKREGPMTKSLTSHPQMRSETYSTAPNSCKETELGDTTRGLLSLYIIIGEVR